MFLISTWLQAKRKVYQVCAYTFLLVNLIMKVLDF